MLTLAAVQTCSLSGKVRFVDSIQTLLLVCISAFDINVGCETACLREVRRSKLHIGISQIARANSNSTHIQEEQQSLRTAGVVLRVAEVERWLPRWRSQCSWPCQDRRGRPDVLSRRIARISCTSQHGSTRHKPAFVAASGISVQSRSRARNCHILDVLRNFRTLP